MTAITVPATVQIKRRHLIILVLAAAALAAALTWAITAVVTDDPIMGRAVPGARSSVVVSTPNLVAVEDRPIDVADAYHGVGVRFCLDSKRPVIVADAYHGVGVAVCV